jgi:hypothetical protein
MIKDLWRRLRNLTTIDEPLASAELTKEELEDRRKFEEEISDLRQAYHDQANQLNMLLLRTEYERRRQQFDRELQRRREAENNG